MYAIMLQLGYIVALIAGYQVGLGAIIFVSVIALIIDAYSYWQCDKIVVRITGARVVSASEAPELHNIVEELCIASGLPKPKIAIVMIHR
jgi:heat shock protein HtpX